MAGVQVPTLGIVGTADPYQRDFEKLKAAMPQLSLVLIEGASHGSAPSRPEYVKAVKEFLMAHPGRTTD
jgi:pimeloyl-ACP methyl ester carboxylesterase